VSGRRDLRRAIVLLAVALFACRGEKEPPVAEEARPALLLLQLAGPGGANVEALAGVIRDDLLAADSTGLLDALGSVDDVTGWEIVSIEPLPELGRAAVDLTATLAGGGSAAFTVQTERDADGTWQVVWLGGPGLEWPHHPRPKGEGLSSSSPPPPR
jgi:hypothetical protein